MTTEQVEHLLKILDYIAGSIASVSITYIVSTLVRITKR